MAEELEVIIGANTKGIEEGATRAERALNDVQKSIKRLERDISENIIISRGYKNAIEDLTRAYKAGEITQTDYSQGIRRLQRDEKETAVETKRLTAEMRNLQREQKQLQVTANDGAGAMNRLGRSTSVNATPAMMDFSRVVQDAPYGIMGVANNIEQLTAQFGYLRTQAGGTKGALKAMLASLAGPAGIMLAVSVVTSLLVAFGDELFKSGEAAKTAAEKLEEYIESLKGVKRAQLDASVSAAKELVQLRLLSRQATNTALATDERKAAVNELRKLYPSYLESMTDEQILANGLAGAYDNITNSIMRKARAQAINNIAVENAEREIKLTQQLADKKTELEKAQSNFNTAQETYNNLVKTGSNPSPFPSLSAGKSISTLKNEIESINKELKDITLENTALQEDFEASGDLIVTPEDVKIKDTGGVKPNIDPIRVPIAPIMGSLKSGTGDPRIQNSIRLQRELSNELELLKHAQSILMPYSKEWDMVGEAIKRTEDQLNGFTNSLAESGRRGAAELAKLGESGAFEVINQKFVETSEFVNIFASSVGTSISQLGNIIQEELAESGKAAQILGGLLINMATQIISQYATMLITEKLFGAASRKIERARAGAKGVTIATNAAAAAGPIGIALLPGLLASTQAMIQGAFAATEGFNFGGFVGDRNLVRVNGNERILTATEANTFNNLMQNRAVNTSQQRVAVDVYVEGGLSGENIHFSQVRYQQKQSRLG